MAKLFTSTLMLLVLLLALSLHKTSAARNLPTPNKKGGSDDFSDQKNVINYGGVGVYSGIGNTGLPFGGIGGIAGTGGDLGGGFPGGGGGGFPTIGGGTPGISTGTGFPTIGSGNGFPTIGGAGGGLPGGGAGAIPGVAGGGGNLPLP